MFPKTLGVLKTRPTTRPRKQRPLTCQVLAALMHSLLRFRDKIELNKKPCKRVRPCAATKWSQQLINCWRDITATVYFWLVLPVCGGKYYMYMYLKILVYTRFQKGWRIGNKYIFCFSFVSRNKTKEIYIFEMSTFMKTSVYIYLFIHLCAIENQKIEMSISSQDVLNLLP